MKNKKNVFLIFAFSVMMIHYFVSGRVYAQQNHPWCAARCDTISMLDNNNKKLNERVELYQKDLETLRKEIKQKEKDLSRIRFDLHVLYELLENLTEIITAPVECVEACATKICKVPQIHLQAACIVSCTGGCAYLNLKDVPKEIKELYNEIAQRESQVKKLNEELPDLRSQKHLLNNLIESKQTQIAKNESQIEENRQFVGDNCPLGCQNCNVYTSIPRVDYLLKPIGPAAYCPGPQLDWVIEDACELLKVYVNVRLSGKVIFESINPVGSVSFNGAEDGSYSLDITAENNVGHVGQGIGGFKIDCTDGADFCGNGKCDLSESPTSCPYDCNNVPDSCGNGACEPNETPANCPADCDVGPVACGNHVCENDEPTTCPSDCAGGGGGLPPLPPDIDPDQDGIPTDREQDAGRDPNNPNDPASSDIAPPDVDFKSPSKVCTSDCSDAGMPWLNTDVPIIYVPIDDTDPSPRVVEGPASGTVFKDEGRYRIRIGVEDWLGKRRVKDAGFGIDKTKPAITPGSSTAQPGSIVDGNVTISPDVSDALSGVRDGSVVILLDGQQVSPGTTLKLPDGGHTVRVIACDQAGNCQELSWSFIVDSAPPVVAIEGIEEGGKYYCPQKATFSAYDKEGLKRVSATSSGTPDVVGVEEGGMAHSDLLGDFFIGEFLYEAPGSHYASVTADDMADNEKTKRVEFKILSPNFGVSVSPAYQKFTRAKEEHKHTVYISNRGEGEATFCLGFKAVYTSQSIAISEVGPCVLIAGGATGNTYFKAYAREIIPGDKLVNKVLAKIQGCEASSGDWLLGRNGAPEVTDHPDDVQDVSSIKTGTLGTISAEAKTLVMMTGFFDGMGSLMQKLNEPVNILLDDFTLLEPGKAVKDYPILILPSGALQGLENSETVKAFLDNYVTSGGFLIAFSQQRGYEFTALPSGKLSGYGWREDQSCLSNAAYIAEPHPIFSRQTKVNMDANIDGYFTVWPKDAKILLRRIKNNMPAMILYKHGQGHVLATTMYPDFGFLSGQTTSDELNIMRDILFWAKDPKDYPEAKPGESISVLLNIVNGTTQEANAVKLIVKDSAGQTIKEEMVALSVPAGQTVQYTYTFSAPPTLGIYAVYYELLFDAAMVQSSTFAENVSVSQNLSVSEPTAGLQFSVTSPGENFVKGQEVTFTIHLFNTSDTERVVNLRDAGHVCRERPIGTFTIPTHSTLDVPYTTACIYFQFGGLNRWDFYILADDAQTGQSLAGWWQIGVAGFWYSPSVSSSLTPDKKSYGPNESGTAMLSLTNTTAGTLSADILFSILNPNNQKIYETAKTGIVFSGNEHKTENILFSLPDMLVPGPYTVQASIVQNGQEIGKASAYFTVEKAKIQISIHPGVSITPSASNPIVFGLVNVGELSITQGNFTLTAKDPDGTPFFTNSQPFTLAVGEGKNLSFPVPFPKLNFGIYKLSYTAFTETGGVLGSFSVNAQPVFAFTADKPRYKGGDTAVLSVKVSNPDRFKMDFPVTLSIPSVSFTQTQNVSVALNEQKTLTFLVPIPSSAQSGVNPVTLTATATKTLTQTFSLVVLPPSFSVTIDKFTYISGDTGTLTIMNTGGLDANVNAMLTASDLNGIAVQNTTDSFALPVGESKQLTFSFSDASLVSGVYRVSLLLKETRSLLKVPFEQYVTFQNENADATLALTPTKTVYTKSETPTMNTTVTPSGTLTDAKLSVRVFLPESAFSVYSQVGSTASLLVDAPYIWFGTVSQGVKRLDTRTNTFTDLLPNTYIYAFASDAAYVYIGTKDALKRYDKTSGQVQSFTIKNIRALYNDGSFLWIGTDTGLKKWDKVNELVTESYTTQNGLPDNAIYSVLVDGTRVYVGLLNKGVAILDKLTKTFSILTKGSGLPDDRVRGMSRDVDAIWVATWGGVVKLSRSGDILQTFTTNEGLADNFTFSVAVDGDVVWVGTLAGLSQYDKSSAMWKNYTTDDGLPPGYVRSLAVDAENVYLGVFTK